MGRRLGVAAIGLLAINFIAFSDAPEAGASFVAGPRFKAARMAYLTAQLSNGRVALIGGHGTGFTSLASAEIYDPAADSFALIQSIAAHDGSALAIMGNGKYLLAGGCSNLGVPAFSAAEIFDPAALSFSALASMNTLRANSGAATLTGEKVLLAGGWWTQADAHTYGTLYDPAANTWTRTGALAGSRSNPFVVACPDDKAVIFGGSNYTGGAGPKIVELYDPSANTFSTLLPHVFGADSGWNPGELGGYSSGSAGQRLASGSYLFMASHPDSSPCLYTFNPTDKSFTRCAVAPPLSRSVGYWPPVVDAERGVAHLLAYRPNDSDSLRLRLYTVNVTTWSRNDPAAWYTVPIAPIFPGGVVRSLCDNGKLLIGGFNTQGGGNTNFSPSNFTLIAQPSVNGSTRMLRCPIAAKIPHMPMCGNSIRLTEQIESIRLCSLRGKYLQRELAAGSRLPLPPGSYIVEFRTSHGLTRQAIVVQR